MDKKDLTTQQWNNNEAEGENPTSSSENNRSDARNDVNTNQGEVSLSLVKHELETGDANTPVRAVYSSNDGQASRAVSKKEDSLSSRDVKTNNINIEESSREVGGDTPGEDVIPVAKFNTVLPKQDQPSGEDGKSDYEDETLQGGEDSSEGNTLHREDSSKEIDKVQSRAERRRRLEIGDVEQKDYSLAEVEEHEESQLTRRQIRKQKKKEQEREKGLKKAERGRIRLFPIWLRVVVVLLLFAGSLVAGAMFGFGIMGEGSPRDILEPESWYQIYDLIFDGTELERAR